MILVRRISRHLSWIWVNPPKERRAAWRASRALIPAAMFSSVIWSRWKLSSAASSASTRGRRNRVRKRRRNLSAERMEISLSSHAGDEVDRVRQPVPGGQLLLELRAAVRGQRIHLGLAAGLRLAPRGSDPGLLLEAVESGVERALLHAQHVGGDLFDPLGDRPAVHGPQGDRLEDQEVEGSLNEVVWFAHEWIP